MQHIMRLSNPNLTHWLDRPLNLANLPVDILEFIAYFVTQSEFLEPPRGVTALSSASRRLRYSLSIDHNPSAYADAFRLKFDTAAPLRRFDQDSKASPPRTGTSGLASELRARFAALRYMRNVVELQNVFAFSKQETVSYLWTIYFMCIESDSKNHKYLLQYGHMGAYARICVDQYLFQSLDAAELLPDTTGRALMMWISWFSTSWGTSSWIR